MTEKRYPYIGNPFGYKLPEPKPIIHPIIKEWNDLPQNKKDDLTRIKEIIISNIGKCEIVLFGSTINGNWDQDSDYDLVINVDIMPSNEVITKIRSTDFGTKVDIFYSNSSSIEKQGVII